MVNNADFLIEEYTIDTPENVRIDYEIAGIGSRFIGALIDTAAIASVLVVLNLIVVLVLAGLGNSEGIQTSIVEQDWSWQEGFVFAFYFLLNFAIVWGYYIIFEILKNGQSPGKQVAKIRVIRANGNPAGVAEIVIRNLIRIIDFLPMLYALGFVVMFANRQTKRLGDYAAGTIVVKEGGEVTLESLHYEISTATQDHTPDARRDELLATYPNIRSLSPSDYELIRDSLSRSVSNTIVIRLCDAITTKLDYPKPEASWNITDSRATLSEIAELYRLQGHA